MTVSKMTLDEVFAVAQLDRALFSAESWSERAFADSLSDESRRFWVAKEGEALLGFCGLSVSFEQGDILNIAVDPAHRKKGIGEALLRTAIEAFIALGGRELFLEVRASNAPARRLYEKCGFLPIGIRRNYYQQPAEDGAIYKLEVTE